MFLSDKKHYMSVYLNNKPLNISGGTTTRFVNFSSVNISSFLKYVLDRLNHIHIWQLSLQTTPVKYEGDM